MKKGIVAILAVYYLAITCGVSVNFHYCMDKLASTEWFAAESDTCGLCGMDTHASGGCCRDEMKVVKLEEEQYKSPVATYDVQAPAVIISVPDAGYTAARFYNIDETRHYHNHSPPLLSAQDTYLRHNVFRI